MHILFCNKIKIQLENLYNIIFPLHNRPLDFGGVIQVIMPNKEIFCRFYFKCWVAISRLFFWSVDNEWCHVILRHEETFFFLSLVWHLIRKLIIWQTNRKCQQKMISNLWRCTNRFCYFFQEKSYKKTAEKQLATMGVRGAAFVWFFESIEISFPQIWRL